MAPGFSFRFISDSLKGFMTGNVGLFLVSLLTGIILSALGALAWTQQQAEET
jgi:hypothetical protein